MWLVEYGRDSWFAHAVRFFVDVLTGVPSIVFGLFIYIVLIVGTGSTYAGYKGSLALSLLMLPVVIRSAEVILLLVPGALRESALALGAPRWRVIFSIVLPTALPGMVTGVLLAIARAAGETAPLLFTAAATHEDQLQPRPVHELAACANLQRRHIPDHGRGQPCLGSGAHPGRHDPAAQPDRPPRSREGVALHDIRRTDPEMADVEPDELSIGADQPERRRPAPPQRRRRRRRDAGPDRRAPAAVEAKPGLSVRLEKLRAFYGDAEQVKGIDLDFHANEVTAIIGPSGCGKSTMVRCINRMHEEIPGARAEGRVLLDDLDVYDPSVDVVAVRRAIGMVFQKPNPFPTMSIFDNVAAGLRLSSRGARRPAARRSRRRCAAPACGTRSQTACPSPAPGCRAASSSGCASRARSPSTPR